MRSNGAPVMARPTGVNLFTLLPLFTTGSVFSHPHAKTNVREGEDALPYIMHPPYT